MSGFVAVRSCRDALAQPFTWSYDSRRLICSGITAFFWVMPVHPPILKVAGNGTLRTTAGTVPGTVPDVTGSGIYRWTISASLCSISIARVGGNRKRTCGQVPAATGHSTRRTSRIVARRLSYSAIRRGTRMGTAEGIPTVLCRQSP